MSVVHSDLAYILKVNTSHYLKEYEIDVTKLLVLCNVSLSFCLIFSQMFGSLIEQKTYQFLYLSFNR